MGKIPKELKPDHHILEQNATVRSDFLDHVRTGRITAHRTTIDKFTETGVCLDNGETLELDAVIFCTGYRNTFPFIAENTYLGKKPNSVHLYRLIVPPKYPNLFFMALMELAGPIHPTVELQARWAVAVLSGRVTLPSEPEMEESIEKFEKEQTRHVSFSYSNYFLR
jgi:dimethylaniline monooxygenase (N-oxide forming)